MSIADVDAARALFEEWSTNIRNQREQFMREPRAWILLANSIWSRAEAIDAVAVFDTKEMAEAYLLAARLPKSVQVRSGGGRVMTHSFRPDSIMWAYNESGFWSDGRGGVLENIQPLLPSHMYEGLPRNPAPPTGPVPEIAEALA